MPLTDIQVKNFKPEERPYRKSDSGGLYLEIRPNGSKYWRLAYRFLGTPKTLALGVYPDVSLAEARDGRQEAKKLLKENIDPSHNRLIKKAEARLSAASVFELVAREWHSQRKAKWSSKHAQKILRRLEIHIFPTIGHLPIENIEITQITDLFKTLDKMEATDVVHRILQYCSTIFDYAYATGRRRQGNPCTVIRPFLKSHSTKHYPRIPTSEIPAFLAKLNSTQTSDQNKLAMELLMLIFVRQGELRLAKWTDINWVTKELVIPEENTKMRRKHIVPLSKQALNVLEKLKPLTLHNPTGLLFPSQNRQKNPGMSENTLQNVITKMGYKDKMVPHGFRSLASTHLNETGKFRSDVIEYQLAHVPKDRVRHSYNAAEYLPERIKMMKYWGNFIEEQRQQTSNVVAGNFKKGAA